MTENEDVSVDIFGASDSDEFEGLKEDDIIPIQSSVLRNVSSALSEVEDVALKEFKIPKRVRSEPVALPRRIKKGSEERSGKSASKNKKKRVKVSGNENTEDAGQESEASIESEDEKQKEKIESDFDKMVRRQKAMRSRRKTDQVDLTDLDDTIAAIIEKMSEAASLDRLANEAKRPALNKLKMLKEICLQLNKKDLQMNFLDQGVLSSIREWLEPLPDGSLSHVTIRTSLLELLHSLPVEKDMLKDSGVGRMVMLLYKHPKEIEKNKRIAKSVIDLWSRPIFGLHSDYREVASENVYVEVDLDPLKSMDSNSFSFLDSQSNPQNPSSTVGKPGHQQFLFHAQVPQPAACVYQNRPKSRVNISDLEDAKRGKGPKADDFLRKFKEKKMLNSKSKQHAMKMSIEGRKVKN
eukprot:Sdes_comp15839_c0_seq1m4922